MASSRSRLSWASTISAVRGELAATADLAFQVYAVERDETGALVPTGEQSRIYGGRWSPVLGDYLTPPPTDLEVHRVACSRPQFAFIVEDESPRLEFSGGRGSGKSEASALRALRFVVERPGSRGRTLAPSYDQGRAVADRLQCFSPTGWIAEYKVALRELVFANGSTVQFRSTKDPDLLRSWDGDWTGIDEEQAVPSEAITISWYCLRVAAQPRMWSTLTPAAGEPFLRHQQRVDDPYCALMTATSRSNCFTPTAVYDQAGGATDATTVAIEENADWSTIAALQDQQFANVAVNFRQAIHCVHALPEGRDFTRRVTHARLGNDYPYIVGADFGQRAPNSATVYRVFQTREVEVWCAVDFVQLRSTTTEMGDELTARGYGPDKAVIVGDASGAYFASPSGGQSAFRELQALGYRVVAPRKNPLIQDRAATLNALLKPRHGPPRWCCLLPACAELARAVRETRWSSTGEHKLCKVPQVVGDQLIDPTDAFDSATYPLHFFRKAPPAHVAVRPLKLVGAR